MAQVVRAEVVQAGRGRGRSEDPLAPIRPVFFVPGASIGPRKDKRSIIGPTALPTGPSIEARVSRWELRFRLGRTAVAIVWSSDRRPARGSSSSRPHRAVGRIHERRHALARIGLPGVASRTVVG